MRWLGVLAPLVCGCFSKPGFTAPGDGGDDDADGAMDVPHNIIFVTSETRVPGSLGSVATADALCDSLAGLAGLPENTYVAWLSTSSQSALERITATGAVGWVRPDGKPVANTAQALASGNHFWPPRFDESGADIAGNEPHVMTGTHRGGTTAPNCNDYASTGPNVQFGLPDGANRAWTEYAEQGCDAAARLYCLGIDHQNPVSPTRNPVNRAAFVSSNAVLATMGRSKMDTECSDEATAVGLPGTFVAAVPITGESIHTRFSSGAPWARHDGVVVLDDSMADLRAPITDTNGQLADVDVFSGVTSFNQMALAGENCSDWNATTAMSVRVGFGFRSLTRAALSYAGASCLSTLTRVYCLQQ
jgi:hypothetical protein